MRDAGRGRGTAGLLLLAAAAGLLAWHTGRVSWRIWTNRGLQGDLQIYYFAAKAWGEGWIYNPEDEERFSAALELAGANTLKVTGYLGIRLLGETFTWKRATVSLQRCPEAVGASTR